MSEIISSIPELRSNKQKLTNKEFAKLPDFITLCKTYDVRPTKRQASRFKLGVNGMLNRRISQLLRV